MHNPDQRISLGVVTVGGEEGDNDVVARPGIRPGDICAPRIFVKAPCSAFQTELMTLERKLRVETFPNTA